MLRRITVVSLLEGFFRIQDFREEISNATLRRQLSVTAVINYNVCNALTHQLWWGSAGATAYEVAARRLPVRLKKGLAEEDMRELRDVLRAIKTSYAVSNSTLTVCHSADEPNTTEKRSPATVSAVLSRT